MPTMCPLEQVADIATVVLMAVANRHPVWNRWNIHAETIRQLMGVRFTTTNDRMALLDQIIERAEAESLRLTLEFDRALSEHFIDENGPRFQSVDQIATVSNLAHSDRVLDMLVGPAGAGKTTALPALHRAWTAGHGRHSDIGLAPSAPDDSRLWISTRTYGWLESAVEQLRRRSRARPHATA